MKITRFVSFSFCLLTFAAHAQNKYTTHTLKQGETLSTLASQYATTVGDIMRLNGMHADTKLVYGSAIKIPSANAAANTTVVYNKTAPVQQAAAAAQTDKITVPATTANNTTTHVVQKGETLYSISKKYNVSVTQLQIINKLPGLSVSIGQQLIISQNAGASSIAGSNTASSNPQKTVTDSYINKPVETTAPAAQPQVSQTNLPQSSNEPAADNQQEENSNTSFNNINANEQPAFTPMGEGYFASQFISKKLKNIEGVSMIFKTASGWSDGKYYILMNEADPGSIVKVTADNGKSIFAKVLWNMGDLKENQGINFRISNAAAMALDVQQDKFNIDISYSKRDAMN